MDVAAYSDAPILRQLLDESRWEWSPYTRDEKLMHEPAESDPLHPPVR